MPESASLRPESVDLKPESMPKSDTAMKDLPMPDIVTKDTLNENTSTRRRPRQKNPTDPHKSSIPTSENLTNSDSDEELDPLTPKQERIRKRYEGMYAGLGAGMFGFSPYSGMVLMQSAKARSEELIRMARNNPVVWKWVEYFANSSDTFNFVAGHGIMLWAIFAHTGRIKGNPAIFQMAGLAEEQVMSPPMGMPEMSQEEMNAYTAAASFNGHSGN